QCSFYLRRSYCFFILVFVLPRPPLRSPLFPYTTLFRSLATFGFHGSHYTLTCDDDHLPDRYDGMRKMFRAARLRMQRWHGGTFEDRKSTRLNSSHVSISYAVFCLKKKKKKEKYDTHRHT